MVESRPTLERVEAEISDVDAEGRMFGGAATSAEARYYCHVQELRSKSDLLWPALPVTKVRTS